MGATGVGCLVRITEDNLVHQVEVGELVQVALVVYHVDARDRKGELRGDKHTLYLGDNGEPDQGAVAVCVGLLPRPHRAQQDPARHEHAKIGGVGIA